MYERSDEALVALVCNVAIVHESSIAHNLLAEALLPKRGLTCPTPARHRLAVQPVVNDAVVVLVR
jgi:hypothetical protein